MHYSDQRQNARLHCALITHGSKGAKNCDVVLNLDKRVAAPLPWTGRKLTYLPHVAETPLKLNQNQTRKQHRVIPCFLSAVLLACRTGPYMWTLNMKHLISKKIILWLGNIRASDDSDLLTSAQFFLLNSAACMIAAFSVGVSCAWDRD